jgi:DNA-binding HxlR family transcriptional regulator
MQRKSFEKMTCPVARTLERVGEWWSILIMRDALYGMRRFDEFQKNLNVAPNILTRRLGVLVEAGLLERQLYCEHPPRYEYVPTQRGWDFRPVLISLQAFGNKHFAPEGASVMLVDAATGAEAEPILVDRRTGKAITEATHRNAAGPAAGERTKRRLARRPTPTDAGKSAAHKHAGRKPASRT